MHPKISAFIFEKFQPKNIISHENYLPKNIGWRSRYIVFVSASPGNQDNTYNYIPTDIICIVKDEDILDKVKENIITKLKAAGFNLKISPVNGGESLNFESFQAGSDVKTRTFKIPIKLFTRNKQIMVQGTPDCQILFMKYFKEFSALGHSFPLKTKEAELLQPETKIFEDANAAKSSSKEAESFVLPTTTQILYTEKQ